MIDSLPTSQAAWDEMEAERTAAPYTVADEHRAWHWEHGAYACCPWDCGAMSPEQRAAEDAWDAERAAEEGAAHAARLAADDARLALPVTAARPSWMGDDPDIVPDTARTMTAIGMRDIYAARREAARLMAARTPRRNAQHRDLFDGILIRRTLDRMAPPADPWADTAPF